MNSFINQFSFTIQLMQKNISLVLAIILLLYALHILNWLTGFRLNNLGIHPRKTSGLIGIFFAPFLHGHFNHLFFNSIPLTILMLFVLINGLATFVCVTCVVIVLCGLGTWLIGRKGLHVGASGLITGYWSYLLIEAYYHPTFVSIALAAVCIYYFGGMLFDLFPSEVSTSWESHFCGFLAGLAAAYSLPFLLPYFNKIV